MRISLTIACALSASGLHRQKGRSSHGAPVHERRQRWGPLAATETRPPLGRCDICHIRALILECAPRAGQVEVRGLTG
jgi:hypothetical protein